MHLQNARPDERVIREFTVSTRYSLIQLVAALGVVVVFYLLALAAVREQLLGIPAKPLFAGVLAPGVLAGLYLAASALYLRLARRYFLTTQRVIEIEGFVSQRNTSADYTNVTDITVLQDAFERFISASGTVEVNTAGGPTKELRLIHVDNPVGVRDQILELSEKAKRLLARIRQRGEDRPVNVAPTSAAFPIATDPTVLDTDNNAVIDAEEGRGTPPGSPREWPEDSPEVEEAGPSAAKPMDESRAHE